MKTATTKRRKARREKDAARACIYCGCTENTACPDGCGWAARGSDVCTACVVWAERLTHPDRAEVADRFAAELSRRTARKLVLAAQRFPPMSQIPLAERLELAAVGALVPIFRQTLRHLAKEAR